MKRRMFGIVMWLLLLLAAPGAAAAADDYVLHPFDVVSINVYGYPELSFPGPGNPDPITIRNDGKFDYPLVGEVSAAGLMPRELAETVKEGLAKYFVAPKVMINVLKFSTQRVYVLGEVNQPGLYEMDRSRNLMDAIGAAKGWTKDAAKTKVFIIHKGQKGDPVRINLLDLLKKGDISQNVQLQEGDIVYLSENHRIDLLGDILPLTQIYYNIRTVDNNKKQ